MVVDIMSQPVRNVLWKDEKSLWKGV